jgi:hypothetical protein
MAFVTTPGGTQHAQVIPDTMDDTIDYDDDDNDESEGQRGRETPAEEDPLRTGGKNPSSTIPNLSSTAAFGGRPTGRSSTATDGGGIAGKLPSVLEAERERARIQEELERERSWRKLREDQAELKALRQQRQAYEAGEVTDEVFLKSLAAPRTSAVPTRSSSFLPRPEPPAKFLGKTQANYDTWLEGCEYFLARSPGDFAEESQKVDFGLLYVERELKSTFKVWVDSKVSTNPRFKPTWQDLQSQMLESMGSKEERMQRAFDDLKKLTQGGRSPAELLNKLRILWAEVNEQSELKKIYDFVSALNEPIRNSLNAAGHPPFKTLADAEMRVNQIHRTLPKSTRPTSTPEGRGKRGGSPPKPSTQTGGGKRGRGGHSGAKGSGRTPKKDSNSTDQPLADRVDKSTVTCYYCNKTGHYKNECPTNPEVKSRKEGDEASKAGGSKKSKGSKS